MSREHIIKGRYCWCNPILRQPCDECDGSGCWKCDMGTRPVYDESMPVIVIHRYEGAPEGAPE